MKFHRNYIWTFLPALVLAAGTVLAGPPQPISECGTQITEPGKYLVVNDLTCGPSEGGITILASNVMLNLGGHTLTCDLSGIPYSGVVVGDNLDPKVFSKVRISNGAVTGCGVGVLLWFTDGARVTKMLLSGNEESGVTLVKAKNNVIKKNTFEGGFWAIYSWAGTGNSYDHNTVRHTFVGIDLYAETDSHITCNAANENYYTFGLNPSGPMPSSGNLVRGNQFTNGVLGLGLVGFGTPPDNLEEPIPTDNLVHANIVLGNVLDITESIYFWADDTNFLLPDAECNNMWKNNMFATQFGPEGCIGTPVVLEDVCAMDEDDD